MTKSEILKLVEKVHKLDKCRKTALPDHSYFLEEDTIVCYPRRYGDSRYPYYQDGLVLFAHTSGYMDCVDGMFNIFPSSDYNEDASVAFFGGEKQGEHFVPVSVTGAARQLFEEEIERYTVFTPVCGYYIAETKQGIYALRVYVDKGRHLRFSFGAVNTGEKRNIYLASFFEPMLRYKASEGYFDRMTKYGEHLDNGSYLMMSRNKTFDCLAVRVHMEGNVTESHFTTAKKTVLGRKGGCLTNALSFAKGCFEEQIPKTNTTDIPVASDMVHFELEEGGFACIHYEMLVTDSLDTAKEFLGACTDAKVDFGYRNTKKEDEALLAHLAEGRKIFGRLQISFEDWYQDTLHPDVVNAFLKCVQRQISFCALGKNYAGPMLGIRDVFQQLETALIWQKDEVRAQIVRVMNYILEDGRAPRQISFPTEEMPVPEMDLRPFIDQGFWIISTLHTYLAYTDDFSILDEVCGYYRAEETYGPLSKSEIRDSLLCHLIKIAEFLIGNLDDKTHCIHALYGDWNDALDGLGGTDEGKEFGDGVSVMATLQLYLALEQICDILGHTEKYPELVLYYEAARERIARGFLEQAVVENEKQEKRIAHGWGDKQAYYVGSFCDYDGKSRISLTANAFYAISGMVKRWPEFKEDIVKNILSLDSRYGLLTFLPCFEGDSPEVGRIADITPGTYENACAYVHAGTFGVMALFLMGHSKEAWEMLEKTMVISHPNATRTTFVMPNSYCESEEYFADGDSMGDWYTGSGTVLIKEIIRNGFGIQPELDGLKIAPARFMPCKKAEISLEIKGSQVTLRYENRGEGKRRMYLGEQELVLGYDDIADVEIAVIDREQLEDCAVITVMD